MGLWAEGSEPSANGHQTQLWGGCSAVSETSQGGPETTMLATPFGTNVAASPAVTLYYGRPSPSPRPLCLRAVGR